MDVHEDRVRVRRDGEAAQGVTGPPADLPDLAEQPRDRLRDVLGLAPHAVGHLVGVVLVLAGALAERPAPLVVGALREHAMALEELALVEGEAAVD